MRFMVMVRANQESEAGVLPKPELFEAMGRFNEEMVKAGVMLAGEGLCPSSKGALIKFSRGRHKVIDGPYAEAKELIAGFWILQVKSKEEAIQWASRCPGGDGGVDHFNGDFEIEVRQIQEVSDFPPEVRAAIGDEQGLRAQAERNRR